MSEAHSHQYVEITVDDGKYALMIQDIHEIIKIQDITQIPNSRPHIKGVINLRGIIVPVISLRNRFGLPELPYDKATRIVVVNLEDDTVGIVVDKVNKVTYFSQVQPSPVQSDDISGEFLSGVGVTDDGLVGILKLEEVLHQ
ncbi:chemotaxis protein CheW [Marinicrinis sediminis]|uniref:Chemotaxis protein CheW n=1 Tax=Marinicrinis sediminis TaxID=1652465 RepID=A0ABW5R8I4_9BACL